MNWWTIIGALLGGGLIQLIATIVGYYAKKHELTVTDDAGLRQSLQQQVTTLMEERKTLVGEIHEISDRCSEIEKQNRELGIVNRDLNAQMLKDQNTYYENERKMRIQLDELDTKVKELTTAKEELSHLKSIIDDLTQAKNEISSLTRMVIDLTSAKQVIDDMLEIQTSNLQTKLDEANAEITRLQKIIAEVK